MDSNSGGEMRSPDTAMRTGPKARRGLISRPSNDGRAQRCLDVGGGEVLEGLQSFDCGGEDLRWFLELLTCVVCGADFFVEP